MNPTASTLLGLVPLFGYQHRFYYHISHEAIDDQADQQHHLRHFLVNLEKRTHNKVDEKDLSACCKHDYDSENRERQNYMTDWLRSGEGQRPERIILS